MVALGFDPVDPTWVTTGKVVAVVVVVAAVEVALVEVSSDRLLFFRHVTNVLMATISFALSMCVEHLSYHYMDFGEILQWGLKNSVTKTPKLRHFF
jgi:hypothetical protein